MPYYRLKPDAENIGQSLVAMQIKEKYKLWKERIEAAEQATTLFAWLLQQSQHDLLDPLVFRYFHIG